MAKTDEGERKEKGQLEGVQAQVSPSAAATPYAPTPAPGGVPQIVMFQPAIPQPVPTRERLRGYGAPSTARVGPVSVAFPPCSDELLALATWPQSPRDDVNQYFEEYFKFRQHQILVPDNRTLSDYINKELVDCMHLGAGGPILLASGQPIADWPSECCFCAPCVTLDGERPQPPLVLTPPLGVKRLFTGDVVWLFYFERLGVFQILGAILDAYAYSGRLPISNGSLEAGLKDDIIALVLEAMVRQMKTGLSSTTRDRGSLYRTSLGWSSEAGRKLGLDTVVSTGFNSLFHKFVYHALEFYKDKRLAFAIRGVAADQPPPSAATLITLRDTIDVLKRRFEAFDYGRNYYNTLAGIVWAISAMSVIRELRTTLGIPPAFESPDEYIPAAYDLLVLKRPVTQGETNRYLVHRECAQTGRDILLDLEVLNHSDVAFGGELDRWLQQIEGKVEGYRTAYRTLTGVDLGASGTPTIEQQA